MKFKAGDNIAYKKSHSNIPIMFGTVCRIDTNKQIKVRWDNFPGVEASHPEDADALWLLCDPNDIMKDIL